MARERRLRAGRVLGSVLRRALLPHHLVRVFRHARRRGRHEALYDFGKQMEFVHGKELTAFNDPQLQLYARILPTMAFARMLGERFGKSILGYGVANLRRNRPAIHYVLAEALEDVESTLIVELERVDPERWVRDRRYMLLVLEPH